MKKLIIVVLVNIFALFMVSNIVSGITIDKWQTLIASAVVLSFIICF
jgi:uncharacterized membrane protein YvlD (DUF360 family)